MISRIDIEDWDQESHQAYLKWAEDYGIDYEPWLGHPDIHAAWQAAVTWMSEREKAQPKRRKWYGLTYEDMDNLVAYPWGETKDLVIAIEAKLKEYNT